jgi:predicted DCC family thiol-disulfide oxidoreductase YuxK
VPEDAGGLLVYDGSCGFCERSAQWVRAKWPPSSADAAVPWQQLGRAELTSLGLDLDDVSHAAWWVEGGRRDGGHRAVARSLIVAGGVWGVVGHLSLVPPLCWFAAIGYRIVAANRGRLPCHAQSCRT